MLNRFKNVIQKEFNIRTVDTHFLLAVSGGLDSRTMAELFFQAGFDFSIVHVNFRLRVEAEEEEHFVAKLANDFKCPFFVNHFETEKYSRENKISIQEAARELRYKWFNELCESQIDKKAFIVTAHHANDNTETLLLNFFRGSGIQGITGIPKKQGNIIRPLLDFKREELEAFARSCGYSWMEDISNLSDKYTRNFFRLNVIPLIEKRIPNVTDNLLQNINRYKETADLYTEIIEHKKKKLCKRVNNEIHFPVLLLKKMAAAKTILWEIIKAYEFTAHQTDEVLKLLDAENGSYVCSDNFRIFKNRKWLVIAPLETTETTNILLTEKNKRINFPGGALALRVSELTGFSLGNSKEVAWLDASAINFPLLLRPWKTGDYFYPLGMKKKKKLSRFFIDEKLSTTEKEKVWVLESNQKIIWVIGYRIDERFKITEKTRKGLRIDFFKN